MPWIIIFIESWILFFLLVDYKKLKYNVYGGILALVLATLVDTGAQYLGLYKFYNPVIPWFRCSFFYKFGPTITMAILFTQLVPRKKYWQLFNIIATSLLYTFLEAVIIENGTAEYFHWSIYASFVFNIILFTAFTWFSLAFIKGKEGSEKTVKTK